MQYNTKEKTCSEVLVNAKCKKKEKKKDKKKKN